MLPVAVARSSSDSNAVCYVLPVLWMMSCSPGGVTGGKKSAVFNCVLFLVIVLVVVMETVLALV